MAKFNGGYGGGMNMNAMMKQAQKMQQDMLRMQEELAAREYDATAGGGVVRAVVDGSHQVKAEIDPEAVDPEDVEMLQDLIVAAVNEAMRIADETAANEMKKVTGGMNLPGGLF